MSYCALLIPQQIKKKEEKNTSFIQSISNKLLSGVNKGGLNFQNSTTVLKNTASLISENSDTIANKFSGIALTQLLVDGKITNDTAFGYLTQGFPKALNQTAIAMGFQSVEQLKIALRNKNGVNVQQFITAFQNFGLALSKFASLNDTKRDVDGFNVIEIDAVLNDDRSYASETPDRRVEQGQTYQEFIHNLPDIFTLNCMLQDGRNYSGDDFEDLILNIRDRKLAINVILGDKVKESIVITNFTPNRESMGGYAYSIEFKKINVGSVETVPFEIYRKDLSKFTPIVEVNHADFIKNSLSFLDTKTEKEVSIGYQKLEPDTTYEFKDGKFIKLENYVWEE